MKRSTARNPLVGYLLLTALSPTAPAAADVYSYMNDAGDYVITKERPKTAGEYAILTDDGEFIELIRPPVLNVPITHWRPWYLPAEPNPLDPNEADQAPEPSVTIEEVGEQ